MTPRARRALVVACAAAGCAVVLALVYAYDPSTTKGLFPPCIFHWATGLQCPGCGATRAMHALLHGDVRTAFAFNPLFVVALPFALAWGVREAISILAAAPARRRLSPRAVGVTIVVLIAYGVVRNILHV